MPKLKIDPLSLVDLDLYPLSDAQKRAQIVDAARGGLAALGSAVLPGFVTAAGVAMMTKEALALAPHSHRRDRMLGAYPDETPKVSDPAHPVNRTSLYRMNVTATDQMDPSGATLALYEWPELTSLVADILCRPVLYLVDDPMMRCNLLFWVRAMPTAGTSMAMILSFRCSSRTQKRGASSSSRRTCERPKTQTSKGSAT